MRAIKSIWLILLEGYRVIVNDCVSSFVVKGVKFEPIDCQRLRTGPANHSNSIPLSSDSILINGTS